ncbi:MAG TPA: DNA polymerase III subunit [Gemmatimonadales bacterium]|jgi:DNA polymerase-3 subunit delta'|nr:DNA polymerase III subunit [Gemmatimonadales bacterium]
MTLAPLAGHHEARKRLGDAFRANRIPQVLLFVGAPGIGRQRLALWLAQLLVCEHPGDEPCGACIPCRKVLGLSHPDVHWLIPMPRPKAAEPGKQVEEAGETLAAIMAERRETPLYGALDGMASHSIASVRLLQRQATLSAVESKHRVFIIGDAERLVPQESADAAANALLKLLEEPPAGAVIILTVADPQRLLPTIRSRTVPLRLHPLPSAEVKTFLEQHGAIPARELDRRVHHAEGSIGAALWLDESGATVRESAVAFLESLGRGQGARLARALRQGPYEARGEFTSMLDALSEALMSAARVSVNGPRRGASPEALRGRDPEALLEAARRVADAREAAQDNVNPQLLLAILGEQLAEIL